MGHWPLKTIFALLPVCVSLCACSSTSETFDCKAGKGVGCQSISTVNQMVDQGVLAEGSSLGLPGRESALPSPVLASAPMLDSERFAPDRVRRIPERHLRVWVAPFQDAQGNFYEGGIVHTVLSPGFWEVGRPADGDFEVGNPQIQGRQVGVPEIDKVEVNEIPVDSLQPSVPKTLKPQEE